MTNGDTDTINCMRGILTCLFTEDRLDEMLDILRLSYGVLGLKFPVDIEQLSDHAKALRYFLFSFLLNIDDAMQGYIGGSNEK